MWRRSCCCRWPAGCKPTRCSATSPCWCRRCSCRWLYPAHSARWSVGVAWFGDDSLLWYRALSLAVRPQRRLPRADLRVEVRREASRDDLALPADVVVLTCQTVDGPQDLAMEPSTLTGFLSWVESAPGVR